MPFLTIIFYICLIIVVSCKKLELKQIKTALNISTAVIATLIFILTIVFLNSVYKINIYNFFLFAFLTSFNAIAYGLFIIYIGLSFTLSKEAMYLSEDLNQNQSQDLLRSQGYINIAKAILFSIITLSVYFFIWIYRINQKLKELTNDQTNPGKSLVAYIFVPFYSIYWAYKKGQQLNEYYLTYNKKTSDFSALYLLLAMFGLSIVAICLMQSEINQIVMQNISNESSYEQLHNPLLKDDYGLSNLNKNVKIKNDISLLKELSELNKNGIISDEEYEEKKREILKRM